MQPLPKPLKCRCGHPWYPKLVEGKPRRPSMCPKCKTVNWDDRPKKLTSQVNPTTPSQEGGKGSRDGRGRDPGSGGEQGEFKRDQADRPEWLKVMAQHPLWEVKNPANVDRLNEDYGHLDMAFQARRALTWLLERKEGRKKRDIWKFFGNWLEKANADLANSPNGRALDPTQQPQDVRLAKARLEAAKREKELAQ